jgi:excisionase family DNA binding protein
VSDKNEDFLSFEKALRELKLRSEELKKLVSEGEIRAYRDGDSMKFRRDDIQALGVKTEGETKLSFADSLEDDTGMVTEQISDEDTLLADDVDDKPKRAAARPARGNVAVAAVAGPAVREPGWVTAVAILGFLVLTWAFFVNYSISQGDDPAASQLTSAWAAKK